MILENYSAPVVTPKEGREDEVGLFGLGTCEARQDDSCTGLA